MGAKWLRKLAAGLLAAALALGCSGCIFRPVDELYYLPALPAEYSDLQSNINNTMVELGAEYATIYYGQNTSTTQLLDLDNNSVQETAAVFLRVPASGEEKPLRIYLYRRSADNTYRPVTVLTGDGTAIHSVLYEDLDGDGYREVIVSWQMSAGVYLLSAYQIGATGSVELMSIAYNEGYLVSDLDRDGDCEIVIFQRDATGESSSRAEVYDYKEQTMTMLSTAPLSMGMLDLVSTRVSPLRGGNMAVYVLVELEGSVVTDVLTLKEGSFVNVTRDLETGISLRTQRSDVDVTDMDINGDGIVEVPIPTELESLDPENRSNQSLLRWYQFDNQGRARQVSVTYHSGVNGWYLILPDAWEGKITVARDDSLSARGERAVVFYYIGGKEPEPFLTIYRLTGSNRSARSRLTGRFNLAIDSSTIYSASLNSEVWNCGVDQTTLGQSFRLITAEWSSQ